MFYKSSYLHGLGLLGGVIAIPYRIIYSNIPFDSTTETLNTIAIYQNNTIITTRSQYSTYYSNNQIELNKYLVGFKFVNPNVYSSIVNILNKFFFIYVIFSEE